MWILSRAQLFIFSSISTHRNEFQYINIQNLFNSCNFLLILFNWFDFIRNAVGTILFIVYQMGRLCGGAHEISGIKAPIFLRGWVGGGGTGGGG